MLLMENSIEDNKVIFKIHQATVGSTSLQVQAQELRKSDKSSLLSTSSSSFGSSSVFLSLAFVLVMASFGV